MSARALLLLLLLLAALAAALRSGGGGAQGEPAHSSLVDKIMNSPISSMEDLQRLLDAEAIEVEEEDEVHLNSTRKRLPRSLVGVQVAQVAACKVRTEVMEVTRSMLDRSNANFMLWPLCVEVQRCSGCCNAHTLQCVPVATQTRHLQMTKIQYKNGSPVFEKVVIPVEDHLTCSCKSRVAPHAPRTKTTPVPPPPPRLPPKTSPPKSQSKEELHRNDDLKHNQRLHLEDQKTQELQWQSKYTLAHTQGYRPGLAQHTPVHTPAGPSRAGHTTFGVPHMQSDTTQHFTSQEGSQEPLTHPDRAEESSSKSEKVPERLTHPGSGDGHVPTTGRPDLQAEHPIHHHHRHHHHHHDSSQSHVTNHDPSQSKVTLHHSGQLEAPVLSYSHVEVIGQSSGQTELANPHSGQSPGLNHSSQQHSQSDGADHQQGQEERLTDLQSSDQDSPPHQRHSHHHLHPTQASRQHQISTPRAVTTAPPFTPPSPQTPPPHPPQRRRRRKHRRRMSKSAMRAMIMIMS